MELDPKTSAVARRKAAESKKQEQKKKSSNMKKWLPASNGTLSQAIPELLLICLLTTGQFDPSLFLFCGNLFRDMFTRLPNLTYLHLCGQALISSLFRCDDQRLRRLLPRLKIVHLYPRAGGNEDYSIEDRLLCSRLSRLARLGTVTFKRNTSNQPFVEAHQPASTASLPPGSWGLEELDLVKMQRIGDLGTLFRSFNASLRSIHLESTCYYSTLVDNLLLLPRTLQSLFLQYGSGHCSAQLAKASLSIENPLPPIDEALYRLTNLSSLILIGPVVSSEVYRTFSRLQKLTFLALDHHVPLDGVEILSLVSGPRLLPLLNRIHVNICHCPDEKNGIRRPRWTEKFSLTHANKCLRKMGSKGIEAEGNWKCAARFCDRGDGHDCSMSLPPIV